MPIGVRRAFWIVSIVLVVTQVHAVLWPENHRTLAVKLIYDACLVVVSALAVLRATRPPERGPWLLVALGVVAFSAGDAYYTLAYLEADDVPFPSPADAGYVLFAPFVLAGILWQVRGRFADRPKALWVDGVAAACAVAAVGAALVLSPVLAGAEGRTLAVAVNAAYPVGDLLLIALTVGVLARIGWQLPSRLVLLTLGVVAFYVTDSLYLVGTLAGWYSIPSPIDTGWWLGLLLITLAAWQPPPRRHEERDDERIRLVVMPLAFAVLALGVLLAATVVEVNVPAVALATISLLAVMGRLVLTFAQNVAMLRTSRTEAHTDPLTGLGNRRDLARHLARRLEDPASPVEPFELVLFDLDGFKHYNDSFGHPAGDALLQRLGRQLVDHVGGEGQAFRMGGDEFCAILAPGDGVAEAAAAALEEEGDGFRIGASHGSIRVPAETADALEAIRVADQRLYATKHSRRGSTSRETADALVQALAAHHPELGAHCDGVADLAEATARSLGVPATELEAIRATARLRDVGKLGVPRSILDKPGALDAGEWDFVRRHTLIGERIIGAAPALLPIARLVRATHERWDGTGYPDGRAGADIPLAARVVGVADAFEAMVTSRPYSTARSPEGALDELRRCAGGQFDPEVVAAFTAAWRTQQAASRSVGVAPA